LGALASSDGGSSIALGWSASAAGFYNTAVGFEASSVGDYSTALGISASSGGESSTAVGPGASSAASNSIALGLQASSSGSYSSALGAYASSPGAHSIALGEDADSDGDFSTALGFDASSDGANNTALGFDASSDGANSTALGYRAFANQDNTVIIGSVAGVNNASAYANIGMGTSAPSQAVDVERSGAAARFQLTSFTADATEAPQYIQRRARGTRLAPTAVQNSDNLGLFSFRGYNGTTMGGSRATITAQAAGNFTSVSTPTRLIFATTPVGQTSPQQVLVITPDGKVQVNGQNLNVPDYVFEDDYQLMPLEELQAFIDANGHLPGIASADEVNAGVHDLTGSDMVHLRKIEELTLYTLQQQERITELESLQVRVAQLEDQLSRLLDERD
jgi:hypothetical protein